VTSATKPLGTVDTGAPVGGLVLAGNDVYALLRPSGQEPSSVARIAVDALAVQARVSLPGRAVGASFANGSVYISSFVGDAGPGTLLRLDGASLNVLKRVSLAAGSDVVARADGVYVAEGDRLERRDPITLAVTATVSLPAGGTVSSLAADPRTPYLWVAVARDQVPLTVAEIDLPTFQVLRSQDIPAVKGGTVSATIDGVWVGAATGMQSRASRVRAADGVIDGALDTENPNFADYTVSGMRLWFAGFMRIGCARLTGGPPLAETAMDLQVNAFAADTHHVYTAEGASLQVAVPAGPCAG